MEEEVLFFVFLGPLLLLCCCFHAYVNHLAQDKPDRGVLPSAQADCPHRSVSSCWTNSDLLHSRCMGHAKALR